MGASLNWICLPLITLKPSVNAALLFGFCTTLLIAICNWVELLIWTRSPLLWVALKILLIPSKATVNVWDEPLPTAVKFMFMLLFALEKLVANLIVLWVSCVM